MPRPSTKLPSDLIGQTLVIESPDTLKSIETNGDEVRVGAYAVRFSGPEEKDLQNEYFTAKTDFGPRNGDGVATMFNHGVPVADGLEQLAIKTFSPVKAIKDEIGIFVETVLNMADQYEAAIADLVNIGKLKWSSGTSYHLARKSKDGEILRWHPIEFSYTPTPAESRLPAIIPLKSVEPDEVGEVAEVLKAVWSTAYINDLPDSAFLYIESGGSKDGEGKTTPRSLRHFPVKDSSGAVDGPHLRNALSRIPQSSLSQEIKDKCKARAQRMLSSMNSRSSDVITETYSTTTNSDTLTSQKAQMDTKTIEELETKVAELESTVAKNIDLHRSDLAQKDGKIGELEAKISDLEKQKEGNVAEQVKARIVEVNEMYALGYQFGNVPAAKEFVNEGKSVADFRTHLMDVLKAKPVAVDLSIDPGDIAGQFEQIKDPVKRTEFFRKNRDAIYAANRELKSLGISRFKE
jgi:hypothetical protein